MKYMPKRGRLLLATWLTFHATPQVFGGSSTSVLDVTLESGMSTGIITIESSSKTTSGKAKTDAYQLGGLPIQFGFNLDAVESLSFVIGPSILVDSLNSVIIRQGLDLAGFYHITGGARRIARTGDAVSIVATSPSNLSLSLKSSFYSYGTRVQEVEFSGSVFEIKVGGQFRRDLSGSLAYGAEIYKTMFTFPASVSRIRYDALEILGFVRMDI